MAGPKKEAPFCSLLPPGPSGLSRQEYIFRTEKNENTVEKYGKRLYNKEKQMQEEGYVLLL